MIGNAGANQAEREGFDAASFRNIHLANDFGPNALTHTTLGHSSQDWLIPVVPGYAGRQPGQIRDKISAQRTIPYRQQPTAPNLPLPYVRLRILPNRRRRTGKRTRQEIEAERRRLRDEIEREIDLIVTEMHELLPRHKAKFIGVAYARYSSEFQHSIADQIRGIFQLATTMGIFIPRKYVFYDLAIRGCKEQRPGLNQARSLLTDKKATVLLVFTTNRLFRKGYKCMKFVEEEIVERGLRCIFVKTGIDTAEGDHWRLPLQLHAMMDELTSTMYAENIRAAHEGLFVQKYVVYTIPFGYAGKEVPGPLTKRHRPRRELIIDPETSEWVMKIFRWFVDERWSITRITEYLNDQNSPLSPMSNDVYWNTAAVRYLLCNQCYRGVWFYGKGQNVWQSKKDYSKRVLRDKPLKEAHFEDLRIISDEKWFKAQQLLSQSPQANAGRKAMDANACKRPRLLNGLLVCKEHDISLRVTGTHGQHMFCPQCRTMPKAKRPIFTYLNQRWLYNCSARLWPSRFKTIPGYSKM